MTNGARPAAANVLLTGRVAALPARVAQELYAAADPLAATRELLARSPLFDAALALASPSLHDSLAPWRDGAPAKKKRAPYKALAYALRMATRPTPFGLFAGAGTVEPGMSSPLRLGPEAERRVRAAPDMAWFHALHERLELDPAVARRLPVVANDLTFTRGERLCVLHPDRLVRGFADDALAWHYEPFSLRLTPTLRSVVEACADEAPLEALVPRVAQRLGIELEVAIRLVDRLLAAGVLIFTRPSPVADPLGELADSLAADPKPPYAELRDARRALDELGAGSAAVDRAALARAVEPLRALQRTPSSPVQLDLVETFEGALPERVVADVLALGALMVANAAPRALDRYRERFVQRFEGAERRVPLLELVDPDAGIGVPDDTSLERADRDRGRDELRLALASRALRDGAAEVVLTRAELDALHPGHATKPAPENGYEIGFQIAASDPEALRDGEYRIRPVFGLSTDGAFKTVSRFAPAFGAPFAERLRALEPEAGGDGALDAELVYVPQDRHYANLLRPALRRHVIASKRERLPPDTPRIEPREIVVGLEDGAFAAWARGRRLRIHESYMLSTPYFAAPHVRLLSLIGKQDAVLPRVFDWGAAAAMPFLPRVRYGRLVLAVAQWNVPRRSLEASKNALHAFLTAWRAEWDVPRWVYLVERDMKLLLDLDSPAAAELLRDEIGTADGGRPLEPSLRFEEMFPAFDQLWLRRGGEPYLHELVAGVPGRPARHAAAAPHRAASAAVALGPGSDRTFVKLYCGGGDVEALLRGPVADLVALCAEHGMESWFFLRYADPDVHVRLRLRAASGRGFETLQHAASLLEPLLAAGTLRRYAFDTYHQEIERYGGAEAIVHAETLFACDSRRVLAALRTPPPAWAARVELAFATLAPFVRTWFAAFPLDAWAGARAAGARSARDLDWSAVRALGRTLLGAEPPEDAERDAVAALAGLAREGTLAADPGALLDSFLHVHFNRAGIPMSDEPALHAMLWHAWHGLDKENRLPEDVRAQRAPSAKT